MQTYLMAAPALDTIEALTAPDAPTHSHAFRQSLTAIWSVDRPAPLELDPLIRSVATAS
jgi:hypothetical protein